MFGLNFIVLVCLCVLGVINLIGIYRNHKKEQENRFIADYLQDLTTKSYQEITKNKKMVEKAKSEVEAASELLKNSPYGDMSGVATDPMGDFESPMMLSTILSVLVKKYGGARLGLDDFLAIGEEYVTVYVDMNTKELILALSSGSLEADALSALKYGSPDDNTFH